MTNDSVKFDLHSLLTNHQAAIIANHEARNRLDESKFDLVNFCVREGLTDCLTVNVKRLEFLERKYK